jgi:hypothetical protein
MDDQVRPAFPGDFHDLGEHGVEIVGAWIPVQGVADMPVGRVEHSAHAFMRPFGSEA